MNLVKVDYGDLVSWGYYARVTHEVRRVRAAGKITGRSCFFTKEVRYFYTQIKTNITGERPCIKDKTES